MGPTLSPTICPWSTHFPSCAVFKHPILCVGWSQPLLVVFMLWRVEPKKLICTSPSDGRNEGCLNLCFRNSFPARCLSWKMVGYAMKEKQQAFVTQFDHSEQLRFAPSACVASLYLKETGIFCQLSSSEDTEPLAVTGRNSIIFWSMYSWTP